MYEQLTLFQPPAPPDRAVYGSGIGQAPALPGRKDSAHMEAVYLNHLLPLEDYDKIIVLFSGGKDSLLGFTLDNKKPLAEYVGNAESCVCHNDPQALRQLTSGEFSVTDVERQEWTMPAGAFHGTAGEPC